jgi:short subunit dehydrogenase-like uncharacterized protein
VLYGAAGFTGRQTAAYFSRHAPPGLHWAIAGRHRDRLEALNTGADVLVADSADQASVDGVISRTRVVLSTAGPFSLYGTPVVDACVRFGTHYADITGETHWARGLVSAYHARAAENGTRIIPFCGFDSVPSDLGSFLLARDAGAGSVRGYFQLHGGGLNGGTIATALTAAASGQGSVASRQPPAGGRSSAAGRLAPRFDEEIGTWTAPFFMSPINTWVVRRSAKLFEEWGEPYPSGFNYQEFLKFDPPFAAVKAFGAAAGLVAFGGAMAWSASRHLVTPLLPIPGEGPSERRMDEGWFSCDLIGRTLDGRRVRGLVKSQGDAGNRSTVKMVCESALALATDDARLPRRAGVLTPATGLGHVLADRLRAIGMTILP